MNIYIYISQTGLSSNHPQLGKAAFLGSLFSPSSPFPCQSFCHSPRSLHHSLHLVDLKAGEERAIRKVEVITKKKKNA